MKSYFTLDFPEIAGVPFPETKKLLNLGVQKPVRVRYNLTRLVAFSKPCPNCPEQKAILLNWALFREDDYDGMRFDKG